LKDRFGPTTTKQQHTECHKIVMFFACAKHSLTADAAQRFVEAQKTRNLFRVLRMRSADYDSIP